MHAELEREGRGQRGGGSIKRVSQRISRHGPELLPAECDVLSLLGSAGPGIATQ